MRNFVLVGARLIENRALRTKDERSGSALITSHAKRAISFSSCFFRKAQKIKSNKFGKNLLHLPIRVITGLEIIPA